jgi:predicted amidohydrolase YtcJ
MGARFPRGAFRRGAIRLCPDLVPSYLGHMPAPDLLVVGRIHTLDPDRPLAEAVLARGCRIVAVGTERECSRAARPGARRVHLGRGAALPGLVDAHGHVVLHGRSLVEVDCRGARSAAECAARAAEAARALPPGRWVRGRGWDETRFVDPRPPDAGLLTAAVPDRPVVLERVDGHAAWVNARALAMTRICLGTPDPPGGRIHRDAAGRPTGILVDRAQDLVLARIPCPSEAEIEDAILRSLGELAALGITAVHDAGVPMPALPVLRRLAEADRLPVRVEAMLDGTAEPALLREAMADWKGARDLGRLAVRAVKLFADGALGSRGAALLEPYTDEPEGRGHLLLDPEDLRDRVREVVAAGWQPAVHAIGDRACREVLRAFAEAGDACRALRPRIEHLQILHPDDVPLLATTAVVASMQPVHCVSDAPWVPARIGPGRARGAYAWRTAARAGAVLAFGSDFPVESPDPRLGLQAAETRRSRTGEVFHPDEVLGRGEALAAFTRGPAWAVFAEGRRGMIREGRDADLTAFAEDVLAVPADELPSAPVALTVVGGRVVHEA